MAGFDPDAYLAQSAAPTQAPAFDPDAYLASASSAPAPPGPEFGSDEYVKSISQKYGVEPDHVRGLIGSQSAASGVEGFPIIGGPLVNKAGPYLSALAHPVTGAGASGDTIEERTAKNSALTQELRSDFKRENPGTDLASQIIGGTAITAPLAAWGPAARLLGITGSLPAQVVRGGLSNAAISAADAATRGGDVGTAAGIGGALGSAIPIVGRGIGAVVGTQASRAAAKAVPTMAEVEAAKNAGYATPEIEQLQFKPGVGQTLSNAVLKELDRSKANDRIAGAARSVVEDLKNPVNGQTHTLEDLRTTRTLLGEMAGETVEGKSTQNARAATIAKNLITKYIDSAPQSHILSGDIGVARQALQTADANNAALETARRVSVKLRNADLTAASTYSGGNLNNTTRQKLRPLLTTKSGSRGLSPDELQTIEDTVRGSTVGNIFRGVGKTLGGSGGFPAAIAGGVGHMFGGPAGAAALLGAGYATRKLGDAITRANANKITNQILARSPLGLQRAAAQQALPLPQRLNLLRALLLSNSAAMPNIQMSQGQQ